MKDTTGVARTTRTAGETTRPAQGTKKVRKARSAPASVPQASPRTTRPRLAPTDSQKSAVPARAARARPTAAGPGRSSSRPADQAASCHAPSQKTGGMAACIIFFAWLLMKYRLPYFTQ